MAKKADTPESVIASADAANSRYSSRKYQGSMDAGVDPVSNTGAHTIQTAKNYAAGDPTVEVAPARVHTERMGAKYAVIAGINKPVDPAVSGQTQANARILPPAINRSGSFRDGSSG